LRPRGEVTMVASTTVPVDAGGAETVMGLIDALEDLDDVQNVYSNVDIPDEVLAALADS
jgi:transcriptional/translational regulatory protein YebC/TACO1